MAWLRETDYEPAFQHFGYPAAVFSNGTDSIVVPGPLARDVVGWKSACGCGWRGRQLYPRREFPSPDGQAPPAVEGYATRSGTYAEWDEHLRRALPELDVHDLAVLLARVQQEFRDAVSTAEQAGVPRARLITIAGAAGARLKFPPEPDHPGRAPRPDHRGEAADRFPPRRPEGPSPGRA